MFQLLANNIFIFVGSYVIAFISWRLSSRLSNIHVRQATKISIVFLAFPIIYLGHPFMFGQCWMLFILSIEKFILTGFRIDDLKLIMILLGIWGMLIVFSEGALQKQESDLEKRESMRRQKK